MSKRGLVLLSGALLLAACASKPPAPPPAPEPVIVTEQPAEPPAVEPAPAKPEQGNGRWWVSVASVRSAELAAPWVKRVEEAGYRATVEPGEVDGTAWHRVVLPGYTRDGAHAILPILAQEGFPNAWIVPRRWHAASAPTAESASTTAPASQSAPAAEAPPAATEAPPAN